MKKLFLALSALVIIYAPAQAAMCFDVTAKAAVKAVQNKMATNDTEIEVHIYTVQDEMSFTSGGHGPYKGGEDYNTWNATGAVYVGGFKSGGIVSEFTVTVYTKADTCEILEAKAEISEDRSNLK